MTSDRIIVVGLGPAGPNYLTVETLGLLEGGAPIWLRTTRHPAAVDLEIAGSFDSLYERSDSFEQVYSAIVSELVTAARTAGTVVYAVPGSPMVAERTVELLSCHPQVLSGSLELDVRPAMSFTALCWRALGLDPMAQAATIIDALSLSVQGAGRIGPLLITQVHSVEVLDEIIGVLDDVAPDTVTVLQALGTTNELVATVAWTELRSVVEPDHLTSLWIPRLTTELAGSIVRLDEMVRELRLGPTDFAGQSFDSVREMLPDATATVSSAIDAHIGGEDDASFELEDGLADLLIVLVLQARLAAEAGFFTIEDVAATALNRVEQIELK